MKEDLIFIKHIIESIRYIEIFSKGLSKKEFKENKLKQNAIIRELEIMGEAVKNLSKEFRDKHNHIEWGLIAGLRDRLIHHYFGVELDRIWIVLEKDLPKIKEEIKKFL